MCFICPGSFSSRAQSACLRARCIFMMSEKAHSWLCGSCSSLTWFALTFSCERWKVLGDIPPYTINARGALFESIKTQKCLNRRSESQGFFFSEALHGSEKKDTKKSLSPALPSSLPLWLPSRQYLSCQTRSRMEHSYIYGWPSRSMSPNRVGQTVNE